MKAKFFFIIATLLGALSMNAQSNYPLAQFVVGNVNSPQMRAAFNTLPAFVFADSSHEESVTVIGNMPWLFSLATEATAIDKVRMDTGANDRTAGIIGYYNLQGRRISKPQSGVIIVRYNDDTSRKILMK